MYKNKTVYDLELIMLSQKPLINQGKLRALIFSFFTLILGIIALILKQLALAIVLFSATVILLVLFLFLIEIFIKKRMKKMLGNEILEISYSFSNVVVITSSVNGKKYTDTFKYSNIYKIIEHPSYLQICLTPKESLLLKKDDEFNSYKNFIIDQMKGRYVIKKK